MWDSGCSREVAQTYFNLYTVYNRTYRVRVQVTNPHLIPAFPHSHTDFLRHGYNTEIKIPATTAEPITPATLGPKAWANKYTLGLDS